MYKPKWWWSRERRENFHRQQRRLDAMLATSAHAMVPANAPRRSAIGKSQSVITPRALSGKYDDSTGAISVVPNEPTPYVFKAPAEASAETVEPRPYCPPASAADTSAPAVTPDAGTAAAVDSGGPSCASD